jgi:23S rRNA (adenine2030-N6)-methyltransferase
LKKSTTPLHWIDTHAGRGIYDLSAKEAQKLKEYESGYYKFKDYCAALPDGPARQSAAMKKYIYLVSRLNAGQPHLYPGSAWLTAFLLRARDRVIACELHKGELTHLKQALRPFKNAYAQNVSGYDQLKEPVLPSLRRGVLIDPSFEVKSEYGQVLETVREIYAARPQDVVLVWYPLLPAEHHHEMVNGFREMKAHSALVQIEECLFRDPSSEGRGLYGSGMVILNGPEVTFKEIVEGCLRDL